MKKWLKPLTALSVGVVMLCSASLARADLIMKFTVGADTLMYNGTTGMVTLGGAPTTNATNGPFAAQGPAPYMVTTDGKTVMQLNLNFDGFTISARSTMTNNPGVAALTLSTGFITNTTGTTATLTIDTTETGVTDPNGPGLTALTSGASTADGRNKSSASFVLNSWIGLTNGEFQHSQPLDGFLVLEPPGWSGVDPGTTTLVAGAPTTYSLTLEVGFTLGGGDTMVDSGSALRTAAGPGPAELIEGVPEPSELMLFLTGLTFLGVGWWLRRRKQA
jgi:hypothetical protein